MNEGLLLLENFGLSSAISHAYMTYPPVISFWNTRVISLYKLALAVHGCNSSTELTHRMQRIRKVIQHLHNMLGKICFGCPLMRQVYNLEKKEIFFLLLQPKSNSVCNKMHFFSSNISVSMKYLLLCWYFSCYQQPKKAFR